jgi:catechol 2,3-dioxygenase-like lactoylglutathione lyase family enzyme
MIRGGIVTLRVSDVGRAVRFYVETLGMKLVEEAADGSATIDAGEGFLIGLRGGEQPRPEANALPLLLRPKVPLAEAIAIYENRGVAFEQTEIGARFRDPDGNPLALAILPGM